MGMVIFTIAAIAALGFFSFGLGGIEKQGNRRAALELARGRLESLVAADVQDIQPADMNRRWFSCTGNPCVWSASTTPGFEQIPVNDLGNQNMETTVQWLDDPSAGTVSNFDALEIGVKVWFSPVTSDDDDHRVYLKTLRAP